MKKTFFMRCRSFLLSGSVLALLLSMASGCQKEKEPAQLPGNYGTTYLVANNASYNALRVDPLLINPWGLAFSGGGTPWLGAQGSGLSPVYDANGNQARLPVAIPSPGAATGGNPTGVVFNGSNDFVLSNGQPARFIFVGVDGVLSAWSAAAGNNAIRILNNVATSAYTGLALAVDGGANFLYAANFRAGRIDVFDKTFAPVTKTLVDPYLPSGYSPFNVQAIGENLYVTYAKVGPDGLDVPGKGNGYVNVFSPGGTLLKRFVSKGELNAPWGVAAAPADFFADASQGFNNGQGGILVGNFGDGRILAYSNDGAFLGALRSNGQPIVLDGLWAISFPPTTATTVDQHRLYFTAGPNAEKDGIFGYILKK